MANGMAHLDFRDSPLHDNGLWARQVPDGSLQAEKSVGISFQSFITALATAAVIFGVQFIAFILLKNRLVRIYKPKTYLVPDKERTQPPPRSPFGWIISIFQFRDREIIKKCGLDAYFFLRYLQTLLVIFIPLACVILPILLPINYIGGRFVGTPNPGGNSSDTSNVTGLDVLTWSNVQPIHYQRYWAHLVLALVVIVWVCYVFWSELRVYIRVRQDYLTSAEHRLRASATTILVSSIPAKWLTHEGLMGLYDVFPGGIRNIWINRNYDELLEKIDKRNALSEKLEGAETELIRLAKKNHKKQTEKDAEQEKTERGEKQKITKAERQAAQKAKDEEARRAAAETDGASSGDQFVQKTVNDALDGDSANTSEEGVTADDKAAEVAETRARRNKFGVPILGAGIKGIGQGFNKGIGLVGRAGDELLGGGQKLANEVGGQVQTTNGFTELPVQDHSTRTAAESRAFRNGNRMSVLMPDSQFSSAHAHAHSDSLDSSPHDSERHEHSHKVPEHQNTEDFGAMRANQEAGGATSWWQFWKPPAGGFPSPLPAGDEGEEFPLTARTDSRASDAGNVESKNNKQSLMDSLPFFGKKEEKEKIEYPTAFNEELTEDSPGGAVWEKYLKKKDRPHHRLPLFSWTPDFLPGIPFTGKKVDTIYWCRKQLAQMNVEIEMDQKHPERFPLMNSAFIQFNNQVAAHMAAQSISHHVPKQMAPRNVEISPSDVIWGNMSIRWWEAWGRTAAVFAIVTGMVILWAIPVAWTATLSNLSKLSDDFPFLSFLQDNKTVADAVSGVLPALVLAIILAIVPIILYQLAIYAGVQTGNQKELMVQNFYFAFLFVQVTLVVSISGTATTFITSSLNDVTSIPATLAGSLPKAANYFFSYMILQALSTSAGTLLQIVTLALWFIMPKFFDNTARQKWARNTTLSTVSWGTFFPTYTNFACITIIYSVIAPLILVFGIITFSLLWVANRYNMLYVSRLKLDTGGLVYPKAINQTFTGLYLMEIVLIGLFLLVRDANDNVACIPQAIIMVVALVLTVFYQLLLNQSFAPLFYHLPITFEDDAVIRDKAFERAQAARLNLETVDEDEAVATEALHSNNNGTSPLEDDEMEMQPLPNSRLRPDGAKQYGRFDPRKAASAVERGGAWAARGTGNIAGNIAALTFGKDDSSRAPAVMREYNQKRRRDVEAQARIGHALFSGYADEIEDLTTDERDVLVKRAFQHSALRARRPTVWIPHDDLGVSDGEIRSTKEWCGSNVWISNEGTALDGKGRVVYGRNPPDFSEVDLIQL